MKKLFLMLMLCAPMTLFAQKFGHLDSQALLQSLPEATAVQSKLEAKGKEYQKQIEDMQSELQRQAEAYDKSKSTMNATKQAETEKSLQDMYNKIQQTAQDNQKAFNEEQQKQLGPVLERFVTLSQLLLRQVTMFTSWRRQLVSHCISTRHSARISLQR